MDFLNDPTGNIFLAGAAVLVAVTFWSLGKVAVLTEHYAKPAREKENKTLLDRAKIKVDELADAEIAKIDREHLKEFFLNFLKQNMPVVEKTKGDHPAADIAAELLFPAVEALGRRNPALVARQKPDLKTVEELLTTNAQESLLQLQGRGA